MSQEITIFHHPGCATSRNVLAMIRNSGAEPKIIEYVKTPPSRERLVGLIERMGITPRELLRVKEVTDDGSGLDVRSLPDDALVDTMLANPILINRPIVETPIGTRLCRPSEQVLDILPSGQQRAFRQEDGEPVVDEHGVRVGAR